MSNVRNFLDIRNPLIDLLNCKSTVRLELVHTFGLNVTSTLGVRTRFHCRTLPRRSSTGGKTSRSRPRRGCLLRGYPGRTRGEFSPGREGSLWRGLPTPLREEDPKDSTRRPYHITCPKEPLPAGPLRLYGHRVSIRSL